MHFFVLIQVSFTGFLDDGVAIDAFFRYLGLIFLVDLNQTSFIHILLLSANLLPGTVLHFSKAIPALFIHDIDIFCEDGKKVAILAMIILALFFGLEAFVIL